MSHATEDQQTLTNPETFVVRLTPAAQAKTREFLAEEDDPDQRVLRIGVAAGGCSGFSYNVLIDSPRPGDTIHQLDGFRMVVDPKSAPLLKNTTIDYVDTVGEAGYTFNNPQAKSSCGCGTSFDA